MNARVYTLSLLLLTLSGFYLRIMMLDTFPLREDEAIYSVWARHWWPRDPLFLTVWPDKPPVFLWLLASVFQLFGMHDASGRWLNVAISVLTIPVVAATARRLGGAVMGLLSAMFLALNPFAIGFASTLFTDPLLVLLASLALYNMLVHNFLWSGLYLGLAIMTKQQGIFYIPLMISIMGLCIHDWWRGIGLMILGLMLSLGPVIYWDSLRWAVAPSPWDLSIQNYGTLILLSPSTWATRGESWLALGWYLMASQWSWLILASVGLFSTLVYLSRHPATFSSCRLAILSILLWGITLFVLHIVTSIQIWDRYLLPLVPVVAIVGGWSVAGLRTVLGSRWQGIIVALLLLCQLPPALAAAHGRYPIGGDHGDYAGLTEALQEMMYTPNNPSQPKFILYHHALGWHYRYYLYDQVQAGICDLRWFPHAVYLADNASKTPHLRKFLIQPAWTPPQNLRQNLAVRRLTLVSHGKFGRFTLYEIMQPTQPFCDWCYSAVPSPYSSLEKLPTTSQKVEIGQNFSEVLSDHTDKDASLKAP